MSDFDPRHPEATRPLEEVAQALKSTAFSPPTGGMDPKVKSQQRAALIHAATPSMSQAETPSPKPRRSLFWIPSFALVGALAVVFIFVLTKGPNAPTTQNGSPIFISQAHAMDAFSLTPEHGDVAGIAIDTPFILKSQVPLTVAQVQNALTVSPNVKVVIEETSQGTFRIKPTETLNPGTVYRITLATTITDNNQPKRAREFSWALQTKNDFRVLSTIPTDLSSRVPTDTGIEFKLSMAGWSDATSSFSISPAVPGRFEAHGRTLVFVPAKKLNPGTKYEVVLKKGLHLQGSDLALTAEKRIRFETEETDKSKEARPFISVNEFQELVPGDTLELSTYDNFDRLSAGLPVTVTGYALSDAQAKQLLQARLSVPEWAPVEQGRYEAYRALKASQAFQVTANLTRQENYGPFLLSLPKQTAPGFFAVKVVPKDGDESWFFLQVTDAATYVTADKDHLMVWAVNASTKKPLSRLALKMDEASAQTDERGLGQLPTPAFLNATNTALSVAPFRILEVGSGQVRALVVVRANATSFWFGMFSYRQQDGWKTTQAYLYADRPLYRPKDELQFFGVAQDRDSRQGVGSVSVRLMRSSFFADWITGDEKMYQEVTVLTDASGRFQGKLSWDELATGYYEIRLYRDGKLVTERGFEVREFIKPAYAISVRPDAIRTYAGQNLQGTIQTHFYDGTPVPKAELELNAGYNDIPTQSLITDGNGSALFQIAIPNWDCVKRGYNVYLGVCTQSPDDMSLQATPKVGEEGEIVGSASVRVFGSALWIESKVETSNNNATVRLETRHVDLAKEDGQGERWGNRALRGEIQASHWVKTENGNYYDFIEKKMVPRYTYTEAFDEVKPINLTTDNSGHASTSFTLEAGKTYRISFEGADDQGRHVAQTVWTAIGWDSSDSRPYADDSPRLQFIPVKNSYSVADFEVGETVTVRLQKGENPFDLSQTPGVLFLVASRGIRQQAMQQDPTYRFSFAEELVPNADIHAITFVDHHFIQHTASANFKYETRKLDLQTIPSKPAYAPGEEVRIHVTAKDAVSGKPVPGTKLVFGAVDKSLLALTYHYPENPLSLLYGHVEDGIVFTTRSHEETTAGYPGAEGGGGPGDVALLQNARKIFKDTAAFGIVELNGDGQGDIVFKAPENLTTWRVEAIAVSSDLHAGVKDTDIAVTQPVFVDVVAPARLLTSDKPEIKLRAYGAGLLAGSPVTFLLNAPSLGINNRSVTGTANQPIYLHLEGLPVGHHVVTFGVKTVKGEDAIERSLDVVASRFLKDELVKINAVAGTTLPDLGAPEADIVISNQGRAALLPQVQALAQSDSQRVDAKAAAELMKQVLHDQFGQPSVPRSSLLSDYQSGSVYSVDGGIRLLPYASSDAELSAEIALTAPELFDQDALIAYLARIMDEPSSSRELQISALAGLAALHEPVLTQLQAMANQKDLTWREQLHVAEGLMAAGDRERASGILEALLQKSETRDGLTSIHVSDKKVDDYEATASAAALAASLGHPKALELEAYINNNWHQDAFPVLAQVRYLRTVLPTLQAGTSRLSWTVNGKKDQAELKDMAKTITLTSAEAKTFKVTGVEGSVVITLVRRVAGRPTSVSNIFIQRSYTSKPLDQLQEGDLVRVRLSVNFAEKTQDGCYQVRDHLPGGWQAVVQREASFGATTYPTSIENGEVTFVTCYSPTHPTSDINYVARVVARGSYRAEAPVVQHSQYPSIAAIGNDQSVIIK